jgi:hypothetical protein
LSKAESAVKSAESADKMLIDRDRKADHVLRDVDKVHKKAQAAAEEAQVKFSLLANINWLSILILTYKFLTSGCP